MLEEQPLQVARCTKIILSADDPEKAKYVINVKQIAKFVVNLGERVSPTDIEEGMRVGYGITLSRCGDYRQLFDKVLTWSWEDIVWIDRSIRFCCRYRQELIPASQ